MNKQCFIKERDDQGMMTKAIIMTMNKNIKSDVPGEKSWF